MGARPALEPEQAEPSLLDRHGRLLSDSHAPEEFALDRRKKLDWAEYVEFESEWMARAARTRDPVSLFGTKPYPALDGLDWADAAHILRSELDGTRGFDAMAMFGDFVLSDVSDTPFKLRERSWKSGFDRAEARSKTRRDPVAMWIDYATDYVWSLKWTDWLHWKQAAAEVTTRLHVGMGLTDALIRAGVREDRAAAEAIFVVEITGATGTWANLIHQTKTR